MIDYQLIRSGKRKTLGLQVKSGKVIVRAPSFLTESQIQSFVAEKSKWLQLKVAQQQQTSPIERMSFKENTLLWFKGEQKKLVISYQPIAQVLNLTDEIRVVLANRSRVSATEPLYEDLLAKKVKLAIESWFKEQATLYITKRLNELSLETNLIPKSLKVRQYKARWGSCNNKGELSFNYLLIMAPHWVIDYVIVHELCHLKHLNHSASFWGLVAEHFPRYKEAKDWLTSHQAKLAWH